MRTKTLFFLILSVNCSFVHMNLYVENAVINNKSQQAIPIEAYIELSKLKNEIAMSKQTNGTNPIGARLPCTCASGHCGCCTGKFLQSFNQKACMNITYEPEEFAFTASMDLNGKLLYKNRMSGKNPRPICIRPPRFDAIRVCVRFSNLYFSGANMHTCINMEADWEEFTFYSVSFDCIRIGASGVAVVSPEDGGGLSSSTDEEDDDDDEDYDDSAR